MCYNGVWIFVNSRHISQCCAICVALATDRKEAQVIMADNATRDAAQREGVQNSKLRGVVLDSGGQPMPGVSVTLRQGQMQLAAMTTTAEGSFCFTHLPLGVYALAVPGITVAGITLDGVASRRVKLTQGTPIQRRYALIGRRPLADAEIGGRRVLFGGVTDEAGAPLNGIKLQMRWQAAQPETVFPETTTGRDADKPVGFYEFVITPGVFSLQVTQGDWPSDRVDGLDTGAGQEDRPCSYQVDFQRQSTRQLAQVTGTVAGAPIGCTVTLVGPDADEGEHTAVLADEGRFAFGALAPGCYQLVLDGFGVIATEICLAAGDLFTQLYPMQSQVVGRANSAQEGDMAVLHARSAPGWTRQALLDPQGGFAFTGLPAGRYRVNIAKTAALDIELTGENQVQIPAFDLRQGGQSVLSGKVLNPAGEPRAGIALALERDGEPIAGMRTQADGAFRFANLPAGCYQLTAGDLGTVLDGLALDGAAEQTQDIVWPDAKRFAHYLWLPTDGAAAQLTLALVISYLRQTGATAGFRLDEAIQADKVTIVGRSLSPAEDAALVAAGCQVDRLPEDSYALAAAIAQLQADTGKG